MVGPSRETHPRKGPPDTMAHKRPLAAGTLLNGRYRIKHLMGEGGFSLVYAAEPEVRPDSGLCVIKELFDGDRCERSSSGDSLVALAEQASLHEHQRQRCREEWEGLRGFRHPNVVEMLDFFEVNNTCYLVMPFVPGESLQDRVSRGPLSLNEVLRIACKLAEGLDALHMRRILHRDVKPENVWLRQADGSPLLLDTGAARTLEGSRRKGATGLITFLGAPELRGPLEQRLYGNVGPATDVYALAGLCAYSLTGKEPPDHSVRLVANNAVPDRAEAWPLPVSDAVSTAIRMGLRLNVAERPQSPGVFYDLLETAHTKGTLPSVRPTAAPLPRSAPQVRGSSSTNGKHSKNLPARAWLPGSGNPAAWLAVAACNASLLAVLALLFDDALLALAVFMPTFTLTLILSQHRRARKGQPLQPLDIVPIVNLLVTDRAQP